jgi:cell division protein FtsX
MRYRFVSYYGDVTDVVMLDFASEQEAWRQAVSAAGEALSDLDGHLGIPDIFVIRVADERGLELFELKVSTRRLDS